MCGRVAQYQGAREYAQLMADWPFLDLTDGEPLERYNVAPSTQVAILRLVGEDLVAQLVRWGWRPFWAQDRAAPINARAEKVAHSRFYSAVWKHRAITPIDGWFEWVDEG
ncbi:TPA: SOS response-associated peptidase family protein, partial [Pseudomonas aeruginosa]|nr:SOS response-associated peptidase family protein [Pseudomonas aeruginosa]